jgi:Zn-dependent protease with chaperone function
MSTTASLYPPCPANVPEDLTEPTQRYRKQVKLVLWSLAGFLLIYCGLLLLAAGMLFGSLLLMAFVPNPVLLIFMPFGLLLFLFLLKSLFKRQRKDRDALIEIHEDEHPRLFEFINQLCDDTGAPFPKAVYVSPDVNASVFYDSSVLNLLVPTQKNLLIGLGLVNVLPLDEFKAVLAHEFGHFSQKSMALGRYVYVAKRIIGDMVYGRDFWDEWVERGKETDIRVAWIAWAVYGMVWVLRQPLKLAFKLIDVTDAALSRQMEFNADRVAVSVAGSDAIVHSLFRLDFANDCLNQALEDLGQAKDHGLYSRDLFYHQTKAAPFVRAMRRKPDLGVVPALPADPTVCIELFKPGDDGVPCMYATHPGNYDREQSAKHIYIRSPRDARSPVAPLRQSGRAA